MTLRIAHVIDGLGPGGAEALLLTNLRHFHEGDFEHEVVSVFAPQTDVYPSAHFWSEPLAALGVPHLALGARSKTEAMGAVARLAFHLRAKRIDVVHTHLLWAGLVGRAAAKLAGVKVISSLHTLSYESEVLDSYANPSDLRHAAMRQVEAASLALADEVVAVGHTVMESAVARLRVDRAHAQVILNPVDFEAFDAAESNRAALASELGLPQNATLLLFVGRVTPSKNQLTAVRAMRALPANAHLLLLGRVVAESYAEEIHETARALGVSNRVHLLGARRDVPAFLAACDVFVFPSKFEGLPVAVVEAAGMGCCCVVSDIPSNHEALGDTALYFDPTSHEALVRQLETVLGDEAKRRMLGESARREARRLYAPLRSVEALTELYRRVAGASRLSAAS